MAKRKRISKQLRAFIAERAHFLCEYCKIPDAYTTAHFDGEHIISVFLGGNSDPSNLAHACKFCNGNKSKMVSAFDPFSKLEVPLFNPRTQIWQDHFRWAETEFLIIGITPTGRATLSFLQLNRKEAINLRGLLWLIGKHPPE